MTFPTSQAICICGIAPSVLDPNRMTCADSMVTWVPVPMATPGRWSMAENERLNHPFLGGFSDQKDEIWWNGGLLDNEGGWHI